ncbi:MAG: glycosyltransferase family 2 protein, partial [Candidatus Halalkalibacterium sp. M3_1C_030]
MPALTEPKVHIIILNWNGKEDTIECLNSLKALEYPNFEIVVVDNASSDGSVSEIKDKFPETTLLESEINRGYAGGNNIGLRYALNHDSDYAWILNNDTVVDKNALGSLVKKMKIDGSIGICGSRLVYYHDRETIQALGG